MKDFENKRKVISIALILIAIVIIFIMAISILGNEKNDNNQGNVVTQRTTNNINYTTTTEGNKVNTSEKVATDKKVGNILLEKNQIVYENKASKLTLKVTNDNVEKDNLRFKVKFIANDGTTIAESVAYVGKIVANETKYIDSYITSDVSNSKDITYEIIH